LVSFLHFFRHLAADNFSAHPDHETVPHSLQAQCLFSPFPQASPSTTGTDHTLCPSLLHITHVSFKRLSMVESAAHLVDHVFPEAPVRQWVLTFPFPLRLLFAKV